MTFKSPKDSLGSLAAEVAAGVISAAADIALVVDGKGVIQDLSFGRPELKAELAGAARWSGRAWADTVSDESQPKVKTILQEVSAGSPSKWRQLSHPAADGGEIPVLYSAVALKRDRSILLGRDLRALASLQQRLVEAQMSMERDYSRLRHAETRYRVLFQTSSEPVLVVDAATDKVVEANPAAAAMFGEPGGRMIGRSFPAGLDLESTQALQSLSTAIRAGLAVDDVRVRLAGGGDEMVVATSLFRQGASAFYLLRFTPAHVSAALPHATSASVRFTEFVKRSTDGYAVVDHDGRVLAANSAFIQMAQIMTEDQVRGEMIDRWLGRSGVDMSVMIANLRHHDTVTMFATILRGSYGAATDVEVSGFSLGGDPATFGLAIRNVGRRLGETASPARQLPHSVDQLKELIGRMSLKEMVRDTTDMIEKLCIEAALELTNDNRASAAEMLGLSRQSLYVKLRRYGMVDEAADAESESS